jgi:glyoxylase-like metal-dependent hydrolase (beta-lactamase superfamily II)
MNRRQFVASSSMAIVAAALRELRATGLYEWQAQPAPAAKLEDLRRGVGVFTGRGGTIGWLATRDGVLVVDSQYADTAPACIDGLKQKSAHPIDVLLNTHHHGDHTAGNKVFRPIVKTIVAHENSAIWQKKSAEQAKTEADQAYPDKTFTDTWKTTIGDETVTAKYYGPGHTSGDVVIVFEKANVVHMGDLMFNRYHPFVDRVAGASITNWIQSLGKVPGEHSADTIYVFGHGKEGFGVTGRKAELAKFREYLSTALDYARRQMQAGKSRDEIVKTDTLPGYEEYGSPAPPRINVGGVLGAAFDELSAT